MPRVSVSCAACHARVERWPCEVGDNSFCSTDCKSRHRTRLALESRDWNITQPRTYKLIPLTKGRFTKVSNEDFEHLSQIAWYMDNDLYAGRWSGKPRAMHVYIYTELMGCSLPTRGRYIVDHDNRDHLDNRRQNLRVATPAQNTMNSSLSIANKSGYRGVRLDGSSWHSYIYLNKRRYDVGWFQSREEAAWMRDQWAIELHGEFAILNLTYL